MHSHLLYTTTGQLSEKAFKIHNSCNKTRPYVFKPSHMCVPLDIDTALDVTRMTN